MFTGGQRKSSNVRTMQIFHELKAQFPTIPDRIISSCITSHVLGNSQSIHQLLQETIAREQNQMGRPSIQIETPPFIPSPETTKKLPNTEVNSSKPKISRSNDMNADAPGNCSESLTSATSEIKSDINKSVAKRPDTLDIVKSSDQNERKLQLSEKCKDVPKLLNSLNLPNKPPKSPLSAKRFSVKGLKKESPSSTPKRETVSTPTQTTDTLVNNPPLSPSLNLSFNVNCQMGLVQSPAKPRCTTRVDLTPTQPWLNPVPVVSDPTAPRSFTTVNLTLRPPTSQPQDPIDITSQNSSLTYSTSSFDKQNGLQSKLQITVGPGNTGSISSVRSRPRSFHLGENLREIVPARLGSLNNLNTISFEGPVVLKQQARIDRMKIELESGNKKLVIMRQEIEDLERKNREMALVRTAAEIEKQLEKEIKHLTYQCKRMSALLDNDQFYDNLYTGPTGGLLLAAHRPRSISSHQQQPQRSRQITRRTLPDLNDVPQFELPEVEGPKWNCSVCTFLNHPFLEKCEQCDMPRVYYVSAAPGDNIHIHVTPRLSSSIAHSWVQ
ncbi:hypothetical protein ABEB36_008733 [Hypothenemus hampei]|uniref:RanBP2-type domain-containing protein n=1 Tax=Hypothenemus hampei TaxID=57062 RepID=A0ABD1EMW7_HYPHA